MFKKGRPKTGGRKKGVTNKRLDIIDCLDQIKTKEGTRLDVSTVVKMFFAGLDTMPPYQQVDALLEFMQYIFPKQKMLEIGNKDGEGFRVEIVDYCKQRI